MPLLKGETGMLLPSLTNRLLAAADMERQGAYFADIGTDHGYLPVYLVLTGRVSRALAADINSGPLARAVQTIEKYGAAGQIDVQLSDGLTGVDPAVTDIAVAGMGGELIANILKQAEWTQDPTKRLILQPMTQDAFLRRFLAENGYTVTKETVAEEGMHLYVIMQAEYDGSRRELTELEALTGRLAESNTPLSQKYLQKKRDTLCRIAEGLLRAGDDRAAEQKRTLANQLEQLLIGGE